MGSKDLDDKFGPAAGNYGYGNRDLDPTHLRAMADRMDGFADSLDAIKLSGSQRDTAIAAIDSNVIALKREFDKLLHLSGRFSNEQIETLYEIVINDGRKKWFRDRAKLYGAYALAWMGGLLTLFQIVPYIKQALKGLFQ